METIDPAEIMIDLLVFPMEILVLFVKLCISYVKAIHRVCHPRQAKDVSGKVILITGSGNKIAREVALRFGKLGAKLALLDLDQAGNIVTAEEITSMGGQVRTYVCDVSKPNDVKKIGSQIRKEFGDVDILINYASEENGKDLLNLSEKEIKRVIDVNMSSHFWTIREVLPSMLKRDSGHIVTLSSFEGRYVCGFQPDFCATKYAVRGLTNSLEEEARRQGKTGIRFTTIFPRESRSYKEGTDISAASKHIKLSNRFGRILQTDEIAEAIVKGILKNRRYVFIPKAAALLDVLYMLLPKRGQQILTDFLNQEHKQRESRPENGFE